MDLQLPSMQLDHILELQQEVDELSAEVDKFITARENKNIGNEKTETRTSKCLL